MAVDDDLTCKEACCVDMREALEAVLNQEIEVISAAPPPAGNPVNVRGIVREVRDGVFVLELTQGQPDREGVFSICNIIGFVTPEPLVP